MRRRSVKVGLDIYTLHAQNPTAREALAFVREQGLQGVQFGNPRQISPTLDHGELREVAEEFAHHGLYLELGLPSVNPHAGSALAHEAGATAGGAHLETLQAAMRACAAAGARILRTVVGWEQDRYNPAVPWAQQLDDVIATLRRLAPLARTLGQKIGIETHCDVTTHEILRMIEAVGDDVVGVCLDTGNLPTRMDEPVAATRRVAPYVICTHTKDALLFTTERSLPPEQAELVDWSRARVTDGRGNRLDPRRVPPALGWQSRPCGQGSLPFPALVEILGRHVPDLALSIEDHGNIQTMPIYQPDWLASYPDLTTHELAELVRLAHEGDRRIAAGEVPAPFVAEAIPWPQRTVRQVEQSAAYLKGLLHAQGLLSA
jgi:sugar phosphate isomerase/epimerase